MVLEDRASKVNELAVMPNIAETIVGRILHDHLRRYKISGR